MNYDLQIDLQNFHDLYAVATSGGSGTDYFITQAKFLYSADSPFTFDTIVDETGNEQVRRNTIATTQHAYVYMYCFEIVLQ